MIAVTPHFCLGEFSCHDAGGTPYPGHWIEERLRPLCETLEMIREAVGGPVAILSGYRTEAYNRSIGGAKLSQHVQGRAADIRCARLKTPELHMLIDSLYRAGKLPHLGGLGRYVNFVHVDVRQGPRLARWTGTRAG